MSAESRALGIRARVQRWARSILRDVHALWLAARDPRTPWYARWLALAIAAYALSPIDLIPDFIPVLGLLDDVLIVPLGVWLVVRLIPEEVLAEHRAAAHAAANRPKSRTAAAAIVAVWVLCALLAGWWLLD
jgi:uncharacterized membrane protein YkvA (DUF1232 family)